MRELLRQVPLFKALGQRDIRFLEGIARQLELPPDTIIFKEGERGDRLYIVMDGELEVIKAFGKPDELVLRCCGPGEPIGEMSFLNPEGIRTATVRTKSRIRLVEITRDDFELLLLGRPRIAYGIASGLSQRMLDSENMFVRTLAEKSRKLAILSKLVSAPVEEIFLPELPAPDKKERRHGAGVSKIQINVLGGFKVFRGETLIAEADWRAKQPKLLLKALITRGASNVPKEVLIDDLWPDASPTSGEGNFKVILHRLRKALEPAMGAGSSYIYLKENMVSLNRNLVRLDLDEFLVLFQRARKAEQAGDIKSAILHGTSAIDLYKGDYLAEDIYVPWAEFKREEIRALFVELLRRMAEIHENQGTSKKSIELYKKLIRTDPAFEEAYQKLMLAYSNRGMRAEAIRVYEECRKALDREVGVGPDKLTISIYKRILEA
jgi:DNA-binding SARP family transcriptional activator/CRP-like cAMP-binding protein